MEQGDLFVDEIDGRLSELPTDKFNKQWRYASSINRCSVADVDNFIKAHYLAKRPAIVVLCLRMMVLSIPVGMVVYSMPPMEVDKRYGGKTWELARLYLVDRIPRNAETWLIGQSVRYIKANHPEIRHLISYADPSAGHRGIIYQAANWKADGQTDDERKTPRNDYFDARTGKKYGRKGNMPADAIIERRPRVSKYRYVYHL